MQDRGTYRKILIERADNGGWSVMGNNNEFAHSGHLIACYSDHDDLIAGLDDLLRPIEPMPPEDAEDWLERARA